MAAQIGGRLDGMVALVTGGSRGLGVTIARELAGAGARVGILARDFTQGEGAASSLRSGGLEVMFVQADLRDDSSIEKAVRRVAQRYGALNLLVNNAALTPASAGGPSGSVVSVSMETWDTFLDTNLTGVIRTVRHVVPHMQTAGFGSIVNINSIVSRHPMGDDVAYAVTKAGLGGLTRAMAIDLAPSIRVNELVLGFIPNCDNPLHHKLVSDPHSRQAIIDAALTDRLGEPSDVGASCVYFCSPESGFITGQSLVLDGGAHVPMRTIAGVRSPFDLIN
jgi:NAD(P)-dependent dehydrogenase (short-subunit alcohol dehydrogenase family)